MPTTLVSFADAEIRMRYKEPYITQGLNAKQAAISPPGTYRGFLLQSNTGLADTVTVKADSVTSDHVVVYEKWKGTAGATRYSLTIRRATGDFSLNFAALTHSTTYIVCIYAEYVVGATTFAEIRAYSAAEWAILASTIKDELVVLGQVVLPAAGIIPAANVTPTYRTPAWMNTSAEAKEWTQVVRNGGFEQGVASTSPVGRLDIAAYWDATQNINGKWICSNALAASGSNALALRLSIATTISAYFTQVIGYPITEGKLIKYRFKKRVLKASSGGSFVLRLTCMSGDSSNAQDIDIPITTNATDAAFVTVEGMTKIPSGFGTTYLMLAIFYANGLVYSGGSYPINVLYIDDVQVWVENDAQEPAGTRERYWATIHTGHVLLEDTDDPYAGGWFAGGLNLYNLGNDAYLTRKDGGISYPQPTFYMPLLNLGMNRVTYESESLQPRITFQTGPDGTAGDFCLLWKTSNSGSALTHSRAYRSLSTGELFFTQNASWGGTAWGKDTSGQQASKILFDNQGLQVLVRQADGTWTDSIDPSTGWQKSSFSSLWDGTNERTILGGQLYDLGKDLVGAAATEVLPRLKLATSSVLDWVFLTEYGSGASTVRLYISTTNVGFCVTINAKQNTSGNWERDAAVLSIRYAFNGYGFQMGVVPTAIASPFGEGSWVNDGNFFYCRQDASPAGAIYLGKTNRHFPTISWDGTPWTDAVAESPRIYLQSAAIGVSKWTHFLGFQSSDVTASSSYWVGYDGSIWETYNAGWDQSANAWSKSDSAQPSYARVMSDGHVMWLFHPAGAGVWGTAIDGTNWYLMGDFVDEGVLVFGGHSTTTRGNPSVTTAVTANAIYAKSQIKAWCRITFDGSSNATLTNGFNVASIGRAGGVGTYIYYVTLATGCYSTNEVCPIYNSNSLTQRPTGYGYDNMRALLEFASTAGAHVDPTSQTTYAVILGMQVTTP